jgi:DNA polymerase III subunit beta
VRFDGGDILVNILNVLLNSIVPGILMKFSVLKENLLGPLQQVVGVVERRQTMPILSNVLLRTVDNRLLITGTDLEVQMIASTAADISIPGEVTVPARKLLDICRSLADGVALKLECLQDKISVQAGKSRFTLATLPAASYPAFDAASGFDDVFDIQVAVLRRALDKTLFAMAQQDVRYYLNGLMLELSEGVLRAVASDGHRLSLCEQQISAADSNGFRQIIAPRKGVLELQRLLSNEDADAVLKFELSSNNLRVTLGHVVFFAKLIEGRFPDFRRVLPKEIKWVLKIDRQEIKSALTRVSILSNDKFRGIQLNLSDNLLSLVAQNPEHEEAQEEIEVEYAGKPFSVGFNVSYLLDAINNVDAAEVLFLFPEDAHSCVIQDALADDFKFIVMPIRF